MDEFVWALGEFACNQIPALPALADFDFVAGLKVSGEAAGETGGAGQETNHSCGNKQKKRQHGDRERPGGGIFPTGLERAVVARRGANRKASIAHKFERGSPRGISLTDYRILWFGEICAGFVILGTLIILRKPARQRSVEFFGDEFGREFHAVS